jgi:putative nucleotidyltransferase with HDIG domain
MNFYRVKQFFWSITSNVNENDKEFIKKYLNIEETNLFYKLSINDQKHSINTAYGVERACSNINEVNSNMLIKTALLHDIGKITCSSNAIIKSLLVLGNFFTSGKLIKFNNIKCIDVYYNHGEIGCRILKELKCNDKMLYLIKNHHDNKIKGNMELDILRKYDNRN